MKIIYYQCRWTIISTDYQQHWTQAMSLSILSSYSSKNNIKQIIATWLRRVERIFPSVTENICHFSYTVHFQIANYKLCMYIMLYHRNWSKHATDMKNSCIKTDKTKCLQPSQALKWTHSLITNIAALLNTYFIPSQ